MPEMPAQTENRRVWILDTIRENQSIVGEILSSVEEREFGTCSMLLNSLGKIEIDALMQDEGIFTREQRKHIYELLK